MATKRNKHFADAKTNRRQGLAHRPGRCRCMWNVDPDSAAAVHRDGWTLRRFQAPRQSMPDVQTIAAFKERLAALSSKERAELIDKGLAALKDLGL